MDRVLAIAGVRFRLLLRRSRGAEGLAKTVATVIVFLLATGFALGMAALFGVLTHVATREADPDGINIVLNIVFYTCLFFALVMPLLAVTVGPGFDASPFRVFPIGRGRLYGVTLAAASAGPEHLLYYPGLAVVFVTGVLLPGAHLGVGLLVFVLVWLFYVSWGNTMALFLAGIMRRRRIREIAAIIVFTLVMVLALVPSLLDDSERRADVKNTQQVVEALRAAGAVTWALPPSLAAEAMTASYESGASAALPSLFWLLLWDVAGVGLGYRVFVRYHLEPPARSRRAGPSKRVKSHERTVLDHPALSFIPVGVRAVVEKDLRYLFRSVMGKLNLFLMPLFAVVVVFVFAHRATGALMGIPSKTLVFFGMLLYASLFSNNFASNLFGWEGGGIRAYFMSPMPLGHVLAGKNLAIWIYNGLLLVLCLVSWSVLEGVPDVGALVTAIPLYAGALLVLTIVGNLTSVAFPVGRDMSTLRNSPSQAAILLSMAALGGTVVLSASLLVLAHAVGMPWLKPVFLVALLAVLIGVHVAVLRLAGRLMAERRERLIEAVRVAQ